MAVLGQNKADRQAMKDAMVDIAADLDTVLADLDSIDAATAAQVKQIVKDILKINRAMLRRERVMIRQELRRGRDEDAPGLMQAQSVRPKK